MAAKYFLSFSSLLLTLALLPADFAEAAKVRSVKGRRVIINTQGDPIKRGDLFYVMSPSGKKKGIIKIRKVKGKAALAVLGRGKAKAGDDLVSRNRAKRKDGQPMARTGTPDTGGPSGSYWGFMAGMSMNSADVSLVDSGGSPAGDVALDGSGFSFKAFYDYPIMPWLWFRGLTGIEQFNVGGENNNVCDNGECTAEIMYLTADFWGRIPFGSDSFKLWVGGGFNLLFPMTKEATALDEGSITNTSIIGVGAGFDLYTSRSSFIPVSVEYGLYPSSDQVDANAIFIRAGYGMSW